MFSLVFAISPTGYLWHHISNAIIMKIRITFTKEFQCNRNVGNHFICLFHLFKWLRYFLKIVELLANGFQFPRIDVVICYIPSINIGNTNFSSLHIMILIWWLIKLKLLRWGDVPKITTQGSDTAEPGCESKSDQLTPKIALIYCTGLLLSINIQLNNQTWIFLFGLRETCSWASIF